MIEQVRLLRKVVVLWLALLTFLTVAGFMWEDQRSCQRQEPVRELLAERAKQLKDAWLEDAERAIAYSRIDSNRSGSVVNARFAANRKALAESVEVIKPIDCGSFPPGL